MKSILWLVIRRRWYLLFAVLMTAMTMNLFIWNEASAYIRNIPTLAAMISEELTEGFDVVTYPKDVVKQHLAENDMSSLSSHLLKLSREGKLRYNKLDYLNGGELLEFDAMELEGFLESDSLQFFNDIVLLQDVSIVEIQELQELFFEAGYTAEIVPFRDQYKHQKNYYQSNLLFGLVVAMVLFVCGGFLLIWLFKSILSICVEEIKVLRLVGFSRLRLIHLLETLLWSPILLALLCFIFLVPQFFGIKLIVWDYLYLVLISLTKCLFISLITRSIWKGEDYA